MKLSVTIQFVTRDTRELYDNVNDGARGVLPKSFKFCAPFHDRRWKIFDQVWQTLAAVLHMSNLSFDRADSAQGEIAAISDLVVRPEFSDVCNAVTDVQESIEDEGDHPTALVSLRI